MSQPAPLREFVGFVWEQDMEESIGTLVEAHDATEAAAILSDVYGADFRVSVWNEDDAARPR